MTNCAWERIEWNLMPRFQADSLTASGKLIEATGSTSAYEVFRAVRWLFLLFQVTVASSARALDAHDDVAAEMRREGDQSEPCQAIASSESAYVAETDLDETLEEQQRIKKIERRATELLKVRDEVVRDRRPIAIQRDSTVAGVAQAGERLAQHQSVAAATEHQIAQLEFQINHLPRNIGKNLRSQQSRLKSTLSSLTRRITADRKIVEHGMPKIYAFNIQIAPLDERLTRLSDELGECRRQWLEIRQPQGKYSMADFEGLRRVLDDWLILDAQWPEAFAWAALCAYELDEISAASVYLEKAQALRAELFPSRRSSPQLKALDGLIRASQPGQISKAQESLRSAARLADEDADWETYFLLGRCYFEQPEDGVRAKSHFLRALKINPNCDSAKLWLARLQTTSPLGSVRNIPAGTAYLEQLWNTTGKCSWRLASFLAEAYSAAQRANESEAMWRIVAELNPEVQRDERYRHGRIMPNE